MGGSWFSAGAISNERTHRQNEAPVGFLFLGWVEETGCISSRRQPDEADRRVDLTE